jgi:hypothetical protein
MQVFAGQASMNAWPFSFNRQQHGIQVLAAAFLALNQRGEGSNPSGPNAAGSRQQAAGSKKTGISAHAKN